MLEIKGFSYSYDKRRNAVDGLTLRVEPGDIYGFIGHNGAGKTTTIRAITGVLDFREGEILVGGASVKRDPIACKRAIAYVPDNPDLYDFMTGMQYLDFICDVFEVDKRRREGEIRKYSDAFELTGNLGDLIASYSRGMKQKLALIGALSHDPRLMVFDEPFVGLDPKAIHTVKGIMREKCDSGCAVFSSTHVLDVAEKLCDKIGIVRRGELVADGATGGVIGDKSLEALFLELIADA